MYFNPHEWQKLKDSEKLCVKAILSCILNKIEGSEEVLNNIKEEVSSLNMGSPPIICWSSSLWPKEVKFLPNWIKGKKGAYQVMPWQTPKNAA